MTAPKILIYPTTDPTELEAIKGIRIRVFQHEQGVLSALDFDGKDNLCNQLIATLNDCPVGTARIRYLGNSAKIERVAVLKKARGQGLGDLLTRNALLIAKAHGCITAIVHAQAYIQPLYAKLGFNPQGAPFEEAGITHLKMQKQLH